MSITAIVLTFNEELHIERCILSLKKANIEICIVDSGSTDRTAEICKEHNVRFYSNPWVNYASQFQWGLDNCNINTKWTMRMDADEYIDEELVSNIEKQVESLGCDGYYVKRKVIFKKRWVRFGGFYPHVLLRVWRTSRGRIENRWMDEHIILDSNKTGIIHGHIVDENLNCMDWWVAKHNSYASREAVDLLNYKYKFMALDSDLKTSDSRQAKIKRIIKENVYRFLPLGMRSIVYFIFRYFLRLGFLDGGRGFVFHFMQGFWYRFLVDVKVAEVEDQIALGMDINDAIKKVTGISL